jgi:hypothetical protein
MVLRRPKVRNCSKLSMKQKNADDGDADGDFDSKFGVAPLPQSSADV